MPDWVVARVNDMGAAEGRPYTNAIDFREPYPDMPDLPEYAEDDDSTYSDDEEQPWHTALAPSFISIDALDQRSDDDSSTNSNNTNDQNDTDSNDDTNDATDYNIDDSNEIDEMQPPNADDVPNDR